MVKGRLAQVRNVGGCVVLVTCLLVVFGRSSVVSPPAPNRSATPAERERIALDLIEPEQQWRAAAKRRFPGDHWSQDDDFHRVEQSRVRRIAGRRKVTLTDVLRAIDEGLRVRPQGRRVTASPCKPRPFYD